MYCRWWCTAGGDSLKVVKNHRWWCNWSGNAWKEVRHCRWWCTAGGDFFVFHRFLSFFRIKIRINSRTFLAHSALFFLHFWHFSLWHYDNNAIYSPSTPWVLSWITFWATQRDLKLDHQLQLGWRSKVRVNNCLIIFVYRSIAKVLNYHLCGEGGLDVLIVYSLTICLEALS